MHHLLRGVPRLSEQVRLNVLARRCVVRTSCRQACQRKLDGLTVRGRHGVRKEDVIRRYGCWQKDCRCEQDDHHVERKQVCHREEQSHDRHGHHKKACRRVVRKLACRHEERNRDRHDHQKLACHHEEQNHGRRGHHKKACRRVVRKLACHREEQSRDQHDRRRRMACRHVGHRIFRRVEQRRDHHRDHYPSDHLYRQHCAMNRLLGERVV